MYDHFAFDMIFLFFLKHDSLFVIVVLRIYVFISVKYQISKLVSILFADIVKI